MLEKIKRLRTKRNIAALVVLLFFLLLVVVYLLNADFKTDAQKDDTKKPIVTEQVDKVKPSIKDETDTPVKADTPVAEKKKATGNKKSDLKKDNSNKTQDKPKVDTPKKDDKPKVDTPKKDDKPKVDTPKKDDKPKVDTPKPPSTPTQPAPPQEPEFVNDPSMFTVDSYVVLTGLGLGGRFHYLENAKAYIDSHFVRMQGRAYVYSDGYMTANRYDMIGQVRTDGWSQCVDISSWQDVPVSERHYYGGNHA